MSFLKDIFKKKEILSMATRGILETPAWGMIEAELRKDIQREYTRLLNVAPDGVLALQLGINAKIEAIKNIYRYARKEWTWSGAADLDLISQVREEDELEREAMENAAGE